MCFSSVTESNILFTGKTFDVHAKVIVNAAGPFTDEVRKLVDKDSKPQRGIKLTKTKTQGVPS